MSSDNTPFQLQKPSRVMSASHELGRKRVVAMSVKERVSAALNMKKRLGFDAGREQK